MEWCCNGDDLEATPKKRMSWISDRNNGQVFRVWVLEGGIKLISRLIESTTKRCWQNSTPAQSYADLSKDGWKLE